MPNADMYDTALLLAQICALTAIAAWLTTGLRDNILYPTQNEVYTAQVMEMARIRDEFPEAYAPVAHRAVTERARQLLAFRTIVVIEGVATVLMWIGVCALGLALFGVLASETARACALIGATAFTAVWAGFLVVGNHFCYWFGHEGAQNTHYQMTLWGLGTILLMTAS